MNAVEDVESNIKQQMGENERLKYQLLQKTQKLENLRFGSTSEGVNEADCTKVNGFFKASPQVQISNESNGVSHLSTPISKSLSPTRHRKEGDDLRSPASDTSSNSVRKQDLAVRVKEQEEEIAKLRKHLLDYSIKESQLRNEKCVLETRIAHMHMAFVQQQQDLVDAQSKALSYRQDIREENSRLKYALQQAVLQEKSTFLSSLVPPLSEYDLQPSGLDAQSIVNNLQVLFKHLQEKLILNEMVQNKLKESPDIQSPYEETLKYISFHPQPPPYSLDAAISNLRKGLVIVPQPAYAHAQSPIFSPLNGLDRMSPPINSRYTEDRVRRK